MRIAFIKGSSFHSTMINPYVALEGISYAGKTTVSKILTKYGFQRVKELAESYENGAGFPPFALTPEDCKKNDEWFLKQEFERSKEAQNLASNGPVVFDRSYISTCAFVWARENSMHLGSYEQFISQVAHKASPAELVMPWIIYLKMDWDVYRERKESDLVRRIQEFGEEAVNNVTIPYQEKKFVRAQMGFYEELAQQNPKSVYVFDGAESPDKIAERIVHLSKSLQKSSPDTIEIEDIPVLG